MVVPAHDSALRPSCGCGWRRRCVSSSARNCAASARSARPPPTYPFVAALVALAADVRAVLGPDTKVTYAADWSEYFGHQPARRQRRRHLPSRSALGLARHRRHRHRRSTGRSRIGATAASISTGRPASAPRSTISPISNPTSAAARATTGTTPAPPIATRNVARRSPTAPASPGCFATRTSAPGGRIPTTIAPAASKARRPTAWVPQSKPIWFTETGCPAIDKGANQPNVFVDPKSSESNQPYYSSGTRDDLMQRLYLQALIEGLRPRASRATSTAPIPRRLSTTRRWSTSRTSTSTPGMHAPIPRSPTTRSPGATARTGGSAIGSTVALPASRSPRPSATFSTHRTSMPLMSAASTASLPAT